MQKRQVITQLSGQIKKEYTTTLQGETREERNVQQQPVTVQSSDQMAVAPNTSQQANSGYEPEPAHELMAEHARPKKHAQEKEHPPTKEQLAVESKQTVAGEQAAADVTRLFAISVSTRTIDGVKSRARETGVSCELTDVESELTSESGWTSESELTESESELTESESESTPSESEPARSKPEPTGTESGLTLEEFKNKFHEILKNSDVSEGMSINDALLLCLTTVNDAIKCVNGLLKTTIKNGKSKAAESKTRYEGEPTEEFQRTVYKSLERLKMNEEIWKPHNVLLLCQTIIREIVILKEENHALITKSTNNRDYNEDLNNNFMNTVIGPIYKIAIGKALENLKQQADTKCSWEYVKVFMEISQVHLFDEEEKETGCCRPPANGSGFYNLRACRDDICRQFVDNEMNYLSSLTDFPLEFAFNRAWNVIRYLLEPGSLLSCHAKWPAGYGDKTDALLEEGSRICSTISEDWGEAPVEYVEQKLAALEDRVLHGAGTVDPNIKRQYTDFLGWHLVQMVRETGGICLNTRNTTHLLEKLVTFYCSHTEYIDTSRALRQDLGILISGLARRILLAKRDHTDNVAELGKALSLIDWWNTKGYLDKECKELYRNSAQPQTVMDTTAKMDKITKAQYKQRIDKIFSCMRNCHSECGYLVAADQLKQLMDEQEQARKTPNTKHGPEAEILSISLELYQNLFNDIIIEFNRKKGGKHNNRKIDSRIDSRMNRHKLEFIQLRPFMFLMKEGSDHLDDWQQAACSAWHQDVMRMSRMTEFSEHDIDQLLYLKEIAPAVPNSIVKPLLQSTLTNLSCFAKRHDVRMLSFAEKITTLLKWADDLKPGSSSATLRPGHTKRGSMLQDTTRERTLTSPDTSSSTTTGLPTQQFLPDHNDARIADQPLSQIHTDQAPLIDLSTPDPWQTSPLMTSTPLHTMPTQQSSSSHNEAWILDQPIPQFQAGQAPLTDAPVPEQWQTSPSMTSSPPYAIPTQQSLPGYNDAWIIAQLVPQLQAGQAPLVDAPVPEQWQTVPLVTSPPPYAIPTQQSLPSYNDAWIMAQPIPQFQAGQVPLVDAPVPEQWQTAPLVTSPPPYAIPTQQSLPGYYVAWVADQPLMPVCTCPQIHACQPPLVGVPAPELWQAAPSEGRPN